MPDELTEQLVSVNGRAVAAVTANGKERAGQTADTSPVTQVDGPLVLGWSGRPRIRTRREIT